MRTNKAPEKIFLIMNTPTPTSLNTTNDCRDKYLPEWYEVREKDSDIEYTRTDAFINKVCEWIKDNINYYLDWYDWGKCMVNKGELIDDLRKAMKGE